MAELKNVLWVCLLAGCAVQPVVPVGTEFRDTLRDGSPGPAMVWIPAGTFTMGDTLGDDDFDELPAHPVTIRAPLAVGKYEITVAEFRRFVNATGYVTDAERIGFCQIQGGKNWRETRFPQTEDHPVVCVSWNDGMAYARWLAGQTGFNYRLPTEAEWEYAARGGASTRFSWGNDIEPGRANCWGCIPEGEKHWTMPVGSFPPNGFGLHDMAGNVWEMTASEWTRQYDGNELRATDASDASDTSGTRAIRGGGWFNGPPDIRPANRGGVPPTDRYNTMGLRVVREK